MLIINCSLLPAFTAAITDVTSAVASTTTNVMKMCEKPQQFLVFTSRPLLQHCTREDKMLVRHQKAAHSQNDYHPAACKQLPQQ